MATPEDSIFIEKWTNEIQDIMSGSNNDVKVVSLLKMIDECQRICPLSSLDSLIFHYTLPSAFKLLSRTINEISENPANISLENKVETSEKLDYCNCLLGCWQKSFEIVKNHNRVSISQVKNSLTTFLEATKCVWGHCKNSEQIYGELINEHADDLKALFMQTKNLWQAFVSLMNNVIVVDAESREDADILINVIDEMGNLAVIVSEIDDYVMTITWKAFAKLIIKYECNMKENLPEKVVWRFEIISRNIIKLLSNLVQDNQPQKKEKNVLYISVLLAILEKLFEIFMDFVEEKTHLTLVELLVQLNSYSPIILKSLKIELSVIKAMELNTSANLESFLQKNLKHQNFFEVFHKYEIKNEKDTLGYHFLVLSILKNLAQFPYDSLKQWILEKISIFDRAMSNCDSLYTEFCIPEFVEIPVVYDLGENARVLSLYEATFTRICNVLCKVSAARFDRVEHFLLKHLLSGQFWSSQLSADIWCFISRLGSAQLRYDHTKLLLKLYSDFSDRETCLEKISLSNLIGRFYLNLSDEQKYSIVVELNDLLLEVWQTLKSDLPKRARACLALKIFGHEYDLEIAFNALWENPSADSWKKLIRALKFHGIVETILNKSMAGIVIKCFENAAKVAEDYNPAWPFFLVEFIKVLLDVVRFDAKDAHFFEPILQSMLAISQNSPPELRIATLNFLINNVQTLSDSKSNVVFQLVGKLFLCFLGDDDACVRMQALDILQSFADQCSDGESDFFPQIMNLVKKDERITQIVKSYVRQDSKNSPENSSMEEFIRLATKDVRDYENEHVCHEFQNGIPNLGEKIESIVKDLGELVEFKNLIPNESLVKLQNAVKKLYTRTNNQ